VNSRRLPVAVVALAVLGGAVLAADLFLPERATATDDGVVPADAVAVARGTFAGQTGHHVAGTVTVYRDADGHFLLFENYEQTQGPDVFVYLTPAAAPATTAEVEGAGLRVLIDGGADGGESTRTGTFTQRLPADLDPTVYGGVSVWCDRFDTPFGAATLRAV
jgi:hypothetical protein